MRIIFLFIALIPRLLVATPDAPSRELLEALQKYIHPKSSEEWLSVASEEEKPRDEEKFSAFFDEILPYRDSDPDIEISFTTEIDGKDRVLIQFETTKNDVTSRSLMVFQWSDSAYKALTKREHYTDEFYLSTLNWCLGTITDQEYEVIRKQNWETHNHEILRRLQNKTD